MKITNRIIAPAIVVIFVGGILLSIGLNVWKTTSSKQPARYSSGRFAGESDPGDIRGSYSFYDIANSFDITTEELAQAFSIEQTTNYGAIEAGDLKDIYGELEEGEIGTDSIKYFVALYTGLPFVPEHDTLLPSTALSLLRDRVSVETMEELKSISVDLPGPLHVPAEVVERVENSENMMIMGSTTFGELTGWGLSSEEIEKALGMKPGKPNANVRDHVASSGMGFGQVKSKLQALLDSKN